MGGPSKATQQAQTNIAQQQANTASQFGALAQQSLGKMDALYQPAISYDTGLVNAANSGNYSQLIQGAGSQIGTISNQFNQAKQNISNTVPAGAGAQAAQAILPGQQAGAVAGTLNSSYQGALSQLAQMGASYGGVGLSEGNTQLSGLQGAASTYGQVGQEQAAGKASTMGFLGSLAGGAGSAAGGYFGNH